MKRFGAARQNMKKIRHHDVFLSRLRLLIIMAKAFTGNYPLGEHRLKAIAGNAETVVKDCVDWNGYYNNFRSTPESNKLLEVDHIFYQRVKLLAIMAKSFAQGSPMGQHRRMAIQNNIDYICEALQFIPEEEKLELLKVA
ncbi:MAG: hypothetical protein QNK29_08735 [Desulfobacterales bacterium]|nr:hypothetical protein [Desulfobacterales bacterium]MDX2512021.1 hypothetical protein [Desulfobacterales bacterium]